MKKIAKTLAIAAILGVSASAQAWWGPFNNNGYGDGYGTGDFDMNFSFNTSTRTNMYGNGYGYGAPAYGYPHYGYPYAAPVAPVAPSTTEEK